MRWGTTLSQPVIVPSLVPIEEKRRRIYAQKSANAEQTALEYLQAHPLPRLDRNPAIVYKLTPWLQRELRIVLGDDDLVDVVHPYALSVIRDMAKEGPERVAEMLGKFLFDDAMVFLAETSKFAASPFDMDTYDRLFAFHQRAVS